MRDWTRREEAKLRRLVRAGRSWKEIGKQLNRTAHACQTKAQRIDVRNWESRRWTVREIRMLKGCYSTSGVTLKELAMELDRTESAIWRKAYNLGLKRHPNKGKKYSASDIEQIREVYPDPSRSYKELAVQLGRNPDALMCFAFKKLKLRRPRVSNIDHPWRKDEQRRLEDQRRRFGLRSAG